MKSKYSKAFVPSAVALLVGGLMFPYPAFAVPRDVGTLDVDCNLGELDRGTVVYLEVGDTFSIYSDGWLVFDETIQEWVPSTSTCLIEDPQNILSGEEADHSGMGAGILDVEDTSEPITIEDSGTFTITEDGGDGATVTFRVTTGILFASPEGVGEGALVGDRYTYEGVFLLGGTTVVDATVTINEIENLNNDEFSLDGGSRDARGGLGSSIEPDNGSLEGFAEYTILFHAPGDPTTPITLSNIAVTMKDIDSLQYIAAENVDSYVLSASPPTNLSARTVGTTLFVEELDGQSSRTEDEENWVVLSFDSASSITIRLGSRDGDGASFNALFAAQEWSSPPAVISTSPDSPAATPTPPALASTGATYEWLLAPFLIATLAGAGFLVYSRRKRT